MGRVRRYLDRQAGVIVDERSRLLAGDEESVHDLRVGIRRFRSTLRTFGPLLPADRTQALDRRLRAWGARLGEVRDLEVLAATLAAHEGSTAPLAADVEVLLAARRDELLAALAEPGCSHLVEDTTAYAREVAVAGGGVGRLARRAARQARRRLARAGDDPARLHRARKAARRARYAAEVVGDAATARHHAHVQSHLGTHHDCGAALEHLSRVPGRGEDLVEVAARLGATAEQARAAAVGSEP